MRVEEFGGLKMSDKSPAAGSVYAHNQASSESVCAFVALPHCQRFTRLRVACCPECSCGTYRKDVRNPEPVGTVQNAALLSFGKGEKDKVSHCGSRQISDCLQQEYVTRSRHLRRILFRRDPARISERCKRLLKVGNEVSDIFNANGNSHQVCRQFAQLSNFRRNAGV